MDKEDEMKTRKEGRKTGKRRVVGKKGRKGQRRTEESEEQREEKNKEIKENEGMREEERRK